MGVKVSEDKAVICLVEKSSKVMGVGRGTGGRRGDVDN